MSGGVSRAVAVVILVAVVLALVATAVLPPT